MTIEAPQMQLLLFAPGTLDPTVKEQLRLSGFLAIEVDRHKEVVTVLPFINIASRLSGDQIAQALVSVAISNEQRQAMFGKAVLEMLREKK